MRYTFDDYRLDTDLRELRRGRELVPLEPQVFDLLGRKTAGPGLCQDDQLRGCFGIIKNRRPPRMTGGGPPGEPEPGASLVFPENSPTAGGPAVAGAIQMSARISDADVDHRPQQQCRNSQARGYAECTEAKELEQTDAAALGAQDPPPKQSGE